MTLGIEPRTMAFSDPWGQSWFGGQWSPGPGLPPYSPSYALTTLPSDPGLTVETHTERHSDAVLSPSCSVLTQDKQVIQ